MLANSEAIQQFKQRRHDSLVSAISKIELVLDFTKMYKLNNDSDKVVKILTNLKSNIKKDSNELKCLNIDSKKDYNKVVEDISDALFETYENVVCKELFDFEDNLKGLFKYAEPEKIPEYTKNIRSLMGLASIQKNKKMEEDLFSIQQNILASLRYNDKIQKEILIS